MTVYIIRHTLITNVNVWRRKGGRKDRRKGIWRSSRIEREPAVTRNAADRREENGCIVKALRQERMK